MEENPNNRHHFYVILNWGMLLVSGILVVILAMYFAPIFSTLKKDYTTQSRSQQSTPTESSEINFEKDVYALFLLILEKPEEEALAKVKVLLENKHFASLEAHLKQDFLCGACVHSTAKMVAYLIEKGITVNHLSSKGLTALHYALMNKNEAESLAISKVLLENGADCNIKSSDKFEIAPLDFAKIVKGKGKEFRRKLFLLYENFNPLCTDGSDGPEMELFYNEAFLKENKKSQKVASIPIEFRMEELRKAAMFGTVAGIKYLLEEAGEEEIDVNSIDCGDFGRKNNYSYLHYILVLDYKNKTRGLEKIKFLVEEKGANVHGKDVDGDSLLHLAAQKSSAEAVEYFIRKGLDVSEKGKLGQTPLSMSAANEDEEERVNIGRILLENGAECGYFPTEGFVKYQARLNSLFEKYKPSCLLGENFVSVEQTEL